MWGFSIDDVLSYTNEKAHFNRQKKITQERNNKGVQVPKNQWTFISIHFRKKYRMKTVNSCIRTNKLPKNIPKGKEPNSCSIWNGSTARTLLEIVFCPQHCQPLSQLQREKRLCTFTNKSKQEKDPQRSVNPQTISQICSWTWK